MFPASAAPNWSKWNHTDITMGYGFPGFWKRRDLGNLSRLDTALTEKTSFRIYYILEGEADWFSSGPTVFRLPEPTGNGLQKIKVSHAQTVHQKKIHLKARILIIFQELQHKMKQQQQEKK